MVFNQNASLTRVSHDSPNMNRGSDRRPAYLLNRFEVPLAFTVGELMLNGFPLPIAGNGRTLQSRYRTT